MAVPVWLPNHAYLATALVTPTSLASGYVWYAQTSGTSGNVEPTWPVTEPWQVVDGGVTWGKSGSARANMVAGLTALLATFQAANPTLLLQYSASRPKSLTNASMPFAYVGDRDETDDYKAHFMVRSFTGLSIIVCDVTPDNAESEARMDALVDGLTTLVAKNFHAAGSRSITQGLGVNGFQPPEDGLYCQLISIGDSFITEGTD